MELEPTTQTMKKARHMVHELERLNDMKFGNASWEIIKKWLGRVDSEWMDDADAEDKRNHERIQKLEARVKQLEDVLHNARRGMPKDMEQTHLWSGQAIIQSLINARQMIDEVIVSDLTTPIDRGS